MAPQLAALPTGSPVLNTLGVGVKAHPFFTTKKGRPVRKIALVGTTSTGVNAPYSDESFEIWGVSMRASYVTRATRWFELHRLDGEPKAWAADWRASMRKFTHDIPEVLMLYPEFDLAPKVSPYPIERIAARFGTFSMTSTFSWMMALAIDEMCPVSGDWEPGEIAIYGVEMEYGTEYAQQRTGFRHFIDLARFAGIKVTLMASGGLVHEPVPYPLWQDDPLLNKLELRNLDTKDRITSLDKSIRDTRTMLAQNGAVVAEIEMSKKKGYRRAERIKTLEEETKALLQTSADLSKDIVGAEAANEEQSWLANYLAH